VVKVQCVSQDKRLKKRHTATNKQIGGDNIKKSTAGRRILRSTSANVKSEMSAEWKIQHTKAIEKNNAEMKGEKLTLVHRQTRFCPLAGQKRQINASKHRKGGALGLPTGGSSSPSFKENPQHNGHLPETLLQEGVMNFFQEIQPKTLSKKEKEARSFLRGGKSFNSRNHFINKQKSSS